MRAARAVFFILVLLSLACTMPISRPEPTVVPDGSGCIVTPPPPGRFDPFYTKYCSARGIPILASAVVPDAALQQAWYIIMNMTSERPDVVVEMLSHDVHYAIIGVGQGTMDLPEYGPLTVPTDVPEYGTVTPEQYWNERARGLGATDAIPLISGAEENLLCYGAGDKYDGENITVHEFSHTMLDLGAARLDESFLVRVQEAYQDAINNGRFWNTYADDNYREYWAEGAQDFYDANLERDPSNGIHNQINTRAELQAYDPALYELLDEVLPAFEWTPGCPASAVAPVPTGVPPTAVGAPDRCGRFAGDQYSLVSLDWQAGEPLVFYLRMPGGVPGLEKPIAEDDQPWNYSVRLGNFQTQACEFLQGYPERLYCTIELPATYANSAQPLELRVNGCDAAVYQNPRFDIPAFPIEPTATDLGGGLCTLTCPVLCEPNPTCTACQNKGGGVCKP